MNQLAVEFLDQGLHRVLFDAMPMPVMVVDEDICILEYNAAAARFLGQDKSRILDQRCGHILHCQHAQETPQGCGHSPSCAECAIRQSVRAATQGRHINRRPASLDLLANGKPAEVDVRVSAHPFNYESHKFVLLMLEDLNE